MVTSVGKFFIEKRWAIIAISIGVLLGFGSAFVCVAWNLVIFGFNIMYIVSPLLAGFVETFIARKKYGRSTGAISALLTFIIINGYGWFAPGWLFPKEPATLSLITIIAILLTLQAAFPILINYILFVVILGIFVKLFGFLVNLPSKIRRAKPVEIKEEQVVTKQADEIFLDELTTPLVSVPNLNGEKIKEYVGLVVGEAIAEEKKSKGLFSKLLKMIEPSKLDELNLGEARKAAISKMLKKAESEGANAVVEVIIEYLSMGGLQGNVTIVSATGTAVIIAESNRIKKVSEKSPIFKMGEIKFPEISHDADESKSKMPEKKMDSTVIKENLPSQNLSLNEKNGQIKEYWEFINNEDLEVLEERFSKVSKDVDKLDKTIKNIEFTNKKINEIKDRLNKF